MRKIVIFSGAGLSAESGIPTFRDSNGLWENHKVEDVAHPSGWAKDKELVINFYKQRFDAIKNSSPNDAHKNIAYLQEKFEVINVTQNIDDLLERSGCKDVRHMHGSINKRKCEWNKSCSLDDDLKYACDYDEVHNEFIKIGDLCPNCGGQMRPDVVWFDEPLSFEFESMYKLIWDIKYKNGIFICIGTSAQVNPAASLISMFNQVKNKYIIDLNDLKIEGYKFLKGTASVKMKELTNQLLAEV